MAKKKIELFPEWETSFNLPKAEYYVYVLELKDNRLYIGVTSNPERRLKEHEKGTASNYTKEHSPVKVLLVQNIGRMEYKEAEKYEDWLTLEIRNKLATHHKGVAKGGHFFGNYRKTEKKVLRAHEQYKFDYETPELNESLKRLNIFYSFTNKERRRIKEGKLPCWWIYKDGDKYRFSSKPKTYSARPVRCIGTCGKSAANRAYNYFLMEMGIIPKTKKYENYIQRKNKKCKRKKHK